jgi:hypothetical protein
MQDYNVIQQITVLFPTRQVCGYAQGITEQRDCIK